MTKKQTPKTPRSIVRNHSPYSESTGPIVQEGFVAARVRALQGFSDQKQCETRSRHPLTPCPLPVYKLRSLSRPSAAFKSLVAGTDTSMPDTHTVMRFHTQALSKDRRNLVNVPKATAKVSDIATAFQPQQQQSTLGPTTPRRSSTRVRGAENPSPTLFKDIVAFSRAKRSQVHVTASNATHDVVSKFDRVDVNEVPAVNPSPSGKSILSPHAIKADLVEPRATWNCLSQTGDRDNDSINEHASKPRGSIADKLNSIVEQGWDEGDIFGTSYADDELASHATESKIRTSDTRLDSRTDSLEEMPHHKQVPSYSGSLPLSNAEKRGESQHSQGQSTSPHMRQKEPRKFVYQGPQKRRKREAKQSHAVNSPQRSSSDAGFKNLKTELAIRDGKRRAWTLHHLGRSERSHRKVQAEASPANCPNYAWDLHGSKQGYESTKSSLSREDSASQSGFDLSMRRVEQVSQDYAALSKMNSSRRSSANTKLSKGSGSRSISFFKNFPWYKVALVDKQPMTQSFSKQGCSDDRTSTTTRATYPGHGLRRLDLSHEVSKSHTPIGCADEEDINDSKTQTALHQGLIDQQAIDAKTSCYNAFSKPSIQLMTSPQELNEQQGPEKIRRWLERPYDSHATSSKMGDERLTKKSDQFLQDVIGQEHGLTRAGRFRLQPRVSAQSGFVDASSEPPIPGDVLQSFPSQGPQVIKQSREQSHTSPHAKSTNLSADKSLEKGSSSSETTRSAQEFPARPSLYPGPRSVRVSMTPKCLGSRTSSLPAYVEKSEQHEPMPRGTQGGSKGIKKIQVTVTFDGAEDLVVGATLRKRD